MLQHKDFHRPACKSFEEDLVLYYYGDCREPESHRVEEHLKECASCAHFLQELQVFLPMTAKPKELPQAFWDRYYGELQEKLEAIDARESWWKRCLAFFSPWGVPALGTAIVLVLALSLTFGKGLWHFKAHPTVEEMPAEIRTAGNMDFFESMDLLDSIDLLEAMEDKGSANSELQKL
jgi:Putative zinc-finger